MKKLFSMILVISIMMSSVCIVSAATYGQPEVVNYFNAFQEYEKVYNVSGAPDGFAASGAEWKTNNIKATYEDGNTYITLGGDGSNREAAILQQFEETILTGKLRVSFNLRVNAEAANDNFSIWGRSNIDNNNPLEASNAARVNLLGFNAGKLQFLTRDIDDNITGTTWKKYDMVFDLEGKQASLYINGEEKATVAMTSTYSGYKAIGITNSGNGTTVNAVDMDDLYIRHFPDGIISAVEMATDYAKGGITQQSGSVSVSFSESLDLFYSSQMVLPADFKVTNVSTDAVFTPSQASSDGINKVKLNFASLESGIYKVECVALEDGSGAYTGKLSGSEPTGSAYFTVANDPIGLDETKYYINENFENYVQGMPANAYGIYYDSRKATGTEKVAGKDSETALKLTNQAVVYEFNNAITAGKFTTEFDIKHTNGRWALMLLTADDLMPADYVVQDDYDSIISGEDINRAEKLRARRETSLAIGSTTSSAEDGYRETIEYNQDRANYFKQHPTDGLTVPKNTWTHVKLVTDLGAGTYTVTIGETTVTYKLNASRFQPQAMYYQDEEGVWHRCWAYGVKGVGLRGTNADSDVYLDNLCVYTEYSYNDYDDFDTFASTSSNYIVQPSWLKQNLPTSSAKGVLAGEDGALKLTNSNTSLAHILQTPIKAGREFNIEFDLKGGAENNVFALELLEESELYTTMISSNKSTTPWTEIVDTVKGPLSTGSGDQYNRNIVLSNTIYPNDTAADTMMTSDGTFRLYNGKNADGDYGIEETVAFKAEEWQHVVLSVKPEAGIVKLKLKVTYNDNTEAESEWYESKRADADTYGVGFHALRTSASKPSSITIDNWKVYETAALSAPYITGVYAKDGIDGSKGELASGMKAGESIVVEFSQAVQSTDGIDLYLADSNGTAADVTKHLAEDGRSVELFFNTMPEVGAVYTLAVSNDVAINADSYMAPIEPCGVTFAVAEDVGQIKVNNFRLYRYYAATDSWAPVLGQKLNPAEQDAEEAVKYKFIAEGYNTGDAINLSVIAAAKGTDMMLMSVAEKRNAASHGIFKLESEEFILDEKWEYLDAFVWELESLTPATDEKLSFDLAAELSQEQNLPME